MPATAAAVVPLIQVTVVVAFVLLATAALVRAPRAGAAGWWAAAAFGTLALALSAVWIPQWLGRDLPTWTDDVRLVLLLAFPYLLLRFTATFRALPAPLELTAAVAGVAAAAVVVVPSRGPTAPLLLLVLAYWTGVSMVTVARLWRAGRGQPGVARRRMRWMAGATAVLAAALITATQLGDAAVVELVTYLFALASAVGFGLGFLPPRALRLSWRRHEDARLQEATAALLRADTVEEVSHHLLPPTAAIVGASGAALVDPDGRVTASHGQAPTVGARAEDRADTTMGPVRETASLGGEQGQLVVWTSPYTPFFGPEERGLFQSMAAIAGLALERCTLLVDERARRAALEQTRQQAEMARGEAEDARRDAEAANQAKNEFLSRMSHELRTPLNAILGFGQLLELSTLPREDREGVGHILKAGRHLLALIDDVLDLSRIEAGMLTISPEPVHAAGLVDDSIALIQPMAASRSIRIITDPEGCDHHVLTDRQRCRQVLLNLLSNAIKYNHDHGEVEVRCSHPDDATLRIAVRDTGPGIDPDRQDRLFQPFERLGAESSGVEGTGLGLALTRQLVERLGGTIGLDTVPGDGSVFWIDLPTTSAPVPDGLDHVTGTATPGGDHQLLFVDDNLENLRLVEAMLRRRPGITVVPAMQGTLALELAYEHRPDVVVLDLHLPDMSGRDVLMRLKANPRTRDIPVIIASADATPRRIRQLRGDGAFDYITKPLELQRFMAVIDAALASADPARPS